VHRIKCAAHVRSRTIERCETSWTTSPQNFTRSSRMTGISSLPFPLPPSPTRSLVPSKVPRLLSGEHCSVQSSIARGIPRIASQRAASRDLFSKVIDLSIMRDQIIQRGMTRHAARGVPFLDKRNLSRHRCDSPWLAISVDNLAG